MAKLQLLEKFTIEVPTGADTFDIIKGGMIPENKKLLKEIEIKFDIDIKKAKKLQKDSNKMNRLEQKISSLTDTIAIIKDEAGKMNLIDKRQALYDELYELQDQLALDSEELMSKDATEIRAKEHIERRVKADDVNKAKLIELCDKYGYALVFETILKDIEEGKSKDKKI